MKGAAIINDRAEHLTSLNTLNNVKGLFNRLHRIVKDEVILILFLSCLFRLKKVGSRRGRIRMVVGFTSTYGITTKVVSSNPFHDEVYSIQYYVIEFVSDLR